jgi:predicted MFS family arabinose efflux permease
MIRPSQRHDTDADPTNAGTVKSPADPCGVIMTFLILLILIVGGVVAYRYRVPLIAKITGQRESRIRHALDERKRK